MKWLDNLMRRSGAGTRMDFEIKIARDPESGVWYVCESAIPGLNAEAATSDELLAIITDLAPELVLANCPRPEAARAPSIPLRIEHFVDAKLAAAY